MTSLDNYSLLWIIVGFIAFSYLIISKTRAPYGRHSKNGWGTMISNSWGWFWMELPAFIIMPSIGILGPADKTEISWLLISLWTYHYFFRTLIFPFRIKTKGKKMPLLNQRQTKRFDLTQCRISIRDRAQLVCKSSSCASNRQKK